jgi:hypothetical protein
MWFGTSRALLDASWWCVAVCRLNRSGSVRCGYFICHVKLSVTFSCAALFHGCVFSRMLFVSSQVLVNIWIHLVEGIFRGKGRIKMQIRPAMFGHMPKFGERVKADGEAALSSLATTSGAPTATSVGASGSVVSSGASAVSAAASGLQTAGAGLSVAGVGQLASGADSSAPESAYNALDSVGLGKAADWSAGEGSVGGAGLIGGGAGAFVSGKVLGKAGSSGTRLKAPSFN